ncbi:MAG: hypothetical protein MZW92_37865 [Comamonadaceae bacterium]|nr:hypothetical protein [Comamonadaceae bacterium]
MRRDPAQVLARADSRPAGRGGRAVAARRHLRAWRRRHAGRAGRPARAAEACGARPGSIPCP